jgi:3',5'-cyclic AMP phosphodiesterase CpdA
MTRIAHISDLHFGRHLPPLVDVLCEEVHRIRPSLVALSGDLTQSARPKEFIAAADFIRMLPEPVLVVPGNHDLPGWRPLQRFIDPWRYWRRYIAPDLETSIGGSDFIAFGVKTARRWGMHPDWSRGSINPRQLARIDRLAGAADPDLVRILVAHHPFLLSSVMRRRGLVGRSRDALIGLRSSRIDLILGGHLHQGYAGIAGDMVVVQAGTAISSRHKGEPNAFNRIEASPDRIEVDALHWNGTGFVTERNWQFHRAGPGWSAAPRHAGVPSGDFAPPGD